jgi:hypothetical protein
MADQEIFKCTVCKMKHRIDGFSVNRLGIRMKSCNSCRARSQRQRDTKKKNAEELKKQELQKVVDEDKPYFFGLLGSRMARDGPWS